MGHRPPGHRFETGTLLIIVLLALIAFLRVNERWTRSSGIDFYQFWAVGKAPGWTTETLKSPYQDQTPLLRVVDDRVAMATGVHLLEARKIRDRLDLTGTPLLYALFGVLPDDYEHAFALYQALQILAFLAAMYLVARRFPDAAWTVATLALILLVGYEPFASDVRVGNVNAFQLAALAGLAVTASGEQNRRTLAPVLPMMVFMTLVLLKPNLIVAAGFFAVHLLFRYGMRRWIVALASSAALAALLITVSGRRYGGWSAWRDWFAMATATGSTRLVYPVDMGNCATGPVAAKVLGGSAFMMCAVLAALLAGSAAFALAIRGKDRAVQAARDPWFMLASGIVTGLALSPLAWNHYYVVTLLPALWLMLSPNENPWVQWLAALSILLSSGLVPLALRAAGMTPFSPYLFSTSWIPLWIGLLVTIRSRPSGNH